MLNKIKKLPLWIKVLLSVFIFFVFIQIIPDSSDSVSSENTKIEETAKDKTIKVDPEKPSSHLVESSPTVNPTTQPSSIITNSEFSLPMRDYVTYLEELELIITRFSNSSIRLGKSLHKSATETPTDIELFGILADMSVIKSSYTDALILTPPPELEEVHEAYLTAFESAKNGVVSFEVYFDNSDPTYVDLATIYFTSSTEEIIIANELMEEFNETYLY